MPDLKISQLSADAAPTVDDLVVLVNDPGGSPTTKKSTVGALVALADGGGALLATLTASNSASLDFATRNAPGKSGALFQSDYDEYLVTLQNLRPATNNVLLRMRVSTNGGSTYDSTSNIYYDNYYVWANGGAAVNSGNGDKWDLVHNGLDLSNSGNYALSGTLRFLDPLNGAFYKPLLGDLIYRAPTATFVYGHRMSSWYLSVFPVNAFQLYCSLGNISVGTVRVYGVAK